MRFIHNDSVVCLICQTGQIAVRKNMCSAYTLIEFSHKHFFFVAVQYLMNPEKVLFEHFFLHCIIGSPCSYAVGPAMNKS